MNYKQYLEIKKDCEVRMKIFTGGVYVIALLSVLQTVFLFFKINMRMNFADLIILNKLYTEGYGQLELGNVVFAGLYYIMYFFIVVCFVSFSFMTIGDKKFPYTFTLIIYGIDTVLCFITATYFQMLFHVVLMIIIAMALKNQHYLNMLKNNTWGYR